MPEVQTIPSLLQESQTLSGVREAGALESKQPQLAQRGSGVTSSSNLPSPFIEIMACSNDTVALLQLTQVHYPECALQKHQ